MKSLTSRPNNSKPKINTNNLKRNNSNSFKQLPIIKNKNKNQKNNDKRQQKTIPSSLSKIYQIIQSFHQTLCHLPLDKLIQSQNPSNWLIQQFKTYQHLLNKLQLYQSNNNINNQYIQLFQFYKAKLDAVKSILKNIQDNLMMLGNIKQQIQYCSNSSSCTQSQRQSNENIKNIHQNKKIQNKNIKNQNEIIYLSSSQSQENFNFNNKILQNIKYSTQNNLNSQSRYQYEQQTSNIKDLANGLLSYDKYQINNHINKNLLASQSVFSSKKQYQNISYLNKENLQFISNINQKKNTKYQTKQTEAQCQQVQLYPQITQENLCQTQLKKYHQSLKSLFNKTSQDKYKGKQKSINYQIKNFSKKTKRIYHNLDQQNSQYQSQQSSDLIPSQISLKQTKQNQKLKKRLLQKDQQILLLKQQLNLYREEVKQNKNIIKQKNKVIQQLLINQQSLNQLIEQIRQKFKEKEMETQFFSERVRILQSSSRKYDIQLQLQKNKQKDFLQIIKRQNQRNLKLQKEYNEMKVMLQKRIKQAQMYKMQKQKNNENMLKNERQMKILGQKCEIYRQKYYKSLNKQKDKESQCHKQLMSMINIHKSQIDRLR